MEEPLSYKLWLREYKDYTVKETLSIPEHKGQDDEEYLKYVEEFWAEYDEKAN